MLIFMTSVLQCTKFVMRCMYGTGSLCWGVQYSVHLSIVAVFYNNVESIVQRSYVVRSKSLVDDYANRHD